jgi:hypothetical protein
MNTMSPQVLVPVLAPAAAVAPLAARRLAAALLQGASRALARAAQRLAIAPAAAPVHAHPAHSLLEFHADAGAPEGALYADGVLVGMLDGVKRL